MTFFRQEARLSQVQALFSIRAVEAKTGLTQHTIRAWEKRYDVVRPHRTSTNRRLYDSNQVDKLIAVRAAVEAGHSVSQVARLEAHDIGLLLASRPKAPRSISGRLRPHEVLDLCLTAVRDLDGQLLNQTLERAAAVSGLNEVIDAVIVPLVETIGDEWHSGRATIGQEHLTTATVRAFLDAARSGLEPQQSSIHAIVATPRNQFHELGASLAATTLALGGCKVTYLGANVPASEIAQAARLRSAKLVCLSIVFPEDDAQLDQELRDLRHLLQSDCQIVVGGRAAKGYSSTLSDIQAAAISSLEDLRMLLDGA